MAAHLPGAAPPESLEAHPNPGPSPSPSPNPSCNPSANPEPCPSPDLDPNPNCNYMQPGDRHLRELAHQRARVRGGRAARRLDHRARRGRRQVGNLDSYSHVLTMYSPRAYCVYLLSTYYGQPLQLRLRAVLAHMAGAEGAAAPRGQRVGRAPLSRR
eukprot:scaffold11083_cov55-Phaeocystis_antarctica.AAC.5